MKTKLNLFGVLLDLMFYLFVLYLLGMIVARLWEGVAVVVFDLRPISNLTGMLFVSYLISIKTCFSLINSMFQIGLMKNQASLAFKELTLHKIEHLLAEKKQELEKADKDNVGEDVKSGKH